MADIQACRNPIGSLWRDPDNLSKMAAHAGLLLSRYLEKQDDKVKDGKKDKDENRPIRNLLEAARKATLRANEIYEPAYRRWASSLENLGLPSSTGVFSVSGRMAIGLGGESVLETGLTLSHTYGTPLIPGSALKGLAAHYCDRVWGIGNSEFKKTLEETDTEGKKQKRAGKYFTELFGTQDDSGHIIFHDAWITPESLQPDKGLRLDVMTPHHGKYYSGENNSAPTDFDDPNPVLFLSITGDFLLAVSFDVPGDENRQWAELSLELLSQALGEWGIGGKTSSGYGRMRDKSSGSAPNAVSYQSGASGLPASEKPKPKYQAGDKVTVTRVEDTKKKKKCFKADDDFTGVVNSGKPPDIAEGEQTELWIATVSDTGYSFVLDEPVNKKKKGRK